MKVFRRIRQRLVSESRLGKYLTYAIGEIVLVVVGILIALAINNGEQERIAARQEQQYLGGLHREFQVSRAKLDRLIEVNQRNYAGAKTLIEYAARPSPPPTEAELAQLLFDTFYSDVRYNPNVALLNELLNSGNSQGISNATLRLQLAHWLSTVDDVAAQEDDLAAQRSAVLALIAGDEYSIRTAIDLTGTSDALGLANAPAHISNLPLLNSLEFENKVLAFMLTSLATHQAHYQPLLQDTEAILDLMEDELK